MTDGATPSGRNDTRGRSKPPSRKPNFPARVRTQFRRGADRVLDADMAWSGAFVVVVVLLMANQHCGVDLGKFSVGDVAPYDVKAPRDIDDVDEALTDEGRKRAQDEVPEVYVQDGQRGERRARELAALFERVRGRSTQDAETGGADPRPGSVRDTTEIPAAIRAALLDERFDAALERELTAAVVQVMNGLIVDDKELLEQEPEIVLLRIPDGGEERMSRYDAIVDLDRARQAVRDKLERQLGTRSAQRQALIDLVASYVVANVHYDAEATWRRREAAARAVPLRLVRVKKGELLIRKGEIFSAETVSRLEAARSTSAEGFGARYVLGSAFVASLLAFFLLRYSGYHQRGFKKLNHLHALLVLMLLSMLLLGQAILWLVNEAVTNLTSPFDQVGTYTYLIPLGAGSILVALLANGRIAMVYSAFASLLFGAVNDWDAYLMIWAMLVQCAGLYAISTYRERAALLRAGLVVGSVGAMSALALEAVKGSLEPWPSSLYGAALALIGGAVGVGLIVSFSLPMLEGLFNVLTDIRLLELSNVNHPLLAQLAIQAPGSYNHSLVVGTLAEEGAKAIGANTLFCRVSAFYHDVGKMNKAEYFVENQRGTNPHDRLSPSMSALIISSHVKDGIKMAREAGLPEQIIDIIPQHHGTKRMSYFYEKAKRTQDPSLGPVKEEEFRYPGPKPQTREAAIFMLADAVEAAARTIEEPTSNRLQDMIRKVCNSIVLDGQLDACDLTFADLQRIQDAFLRLLVSMYHHRVDYPGFDFGRPKSVEADTTVAGAATRNS